MGELAPHTRTYAVASTKQLLDLYSLHTATPWREAHRRAYVLRLAGYWDLDPAGRGAKVVLREPDVACFLLSMLATDSHVAAAGAAAVYNNLRPDGKAQAPGQGERLIDDLVPDDALVGAVSFLLHLARIPERRPLIEKRLLGLSLYRRAPLAEITYKTRRGAVRQQQFMPVPRDDGMMRVAKQHIRVTDSAMSITATFPAQIILDIGELMGEPEFGAAQVKAAD